MMRGAPMPHSGPIRVIIVDDHPVVRFGLAAIIGLQPDMTVAGEVGSGEEAVSLCSRQAADVVLMDLRLPISVVRFGLAAIIGLQPDMTVAGEVGSGEEAVSLCSRQAADVVLMDLRLP